MITVSSAFEQAVNESSRQWRARLLYNGSDTGASIKSFTVKGGSNNDSAFTLCGVYGSSFEATVDNLVGFTWENKKITVQMAIGVNGAFDWTNNAITLGVFTIVEVQRSPNMSILYGVGNLTAVGGEDFTPPSVQSISNILNAISQQKAYNVITLLDANYGLPVENAILCFRS